MMGSKKRCQRYTKLTVCDFLNIYETYDRNSGFPRDPGLVTDVNYVTCHMILHELEQIRISQTTKNVCVKPPSRKLAL